MIPPHEAHDKAKLTALTADMARRGYRGAPLVAFGEYLITGSHRHAAMRIAGIAIEDHVIAIEAVFEEAGLDFGAAWALEDQPTYDWWDVMTIVCRALPKDLRNKYGIDLE